MISHTLECNALHVEIIISKSVFRRKFKTPSPFHRSLSNGWNKQGGISNRSFWKASVKQGFYQIKHRLDELSIHYFIELNNPNRIEDFWKSLRYRIKNLILGQLKRYENTNSQNIHDTYNQRDIIQSFGCLYRT
jgi:hypothetical protein